MNIVFFDGVCGLCNRSVDFIIARDHKRVLRVASLQGETAKRMLPDVYLKEIESIVFFENGKVYTKSAAALRIGLRLGGLWRLAAIFFVVPSFLRDLLYDFIARNRYKRFGKRDSCRLPTPQERDYFLP